MPAPIRIESATIQALAMRQDVEDPDTGDFTPHPEYGDCPSIEFRLPPGAELPVKRLGGRWTVTIEESPDA